LRCRVLTLEQATYSVISPEGTAGIVCYMGCRKGKMPTEYFNLTHSPLGINKSPAYSSLPMMWGARYTSVELLIKINLVLIYFCTLYHIIADGLRISI